MKVGVQRREGDMCTKFTLGIEDPHFAIESEDSYPVKMEDQHTVVIVHSEDDLERSLEILESGWPDEVFEGDWPDMNQLQCEVNHYYGK